MFYILCTFGDTGTARCGKLKSPTFIVMDNDDEVRRGWEEQ